MVKGLKRILTLTACMVATLAMAGIACAKENNGTTAVENKLANSGIRMDFSSDDIPNGVYEEDGNYYFYKNGVLQTGLFYSYEETKPYDWNLTIRMVKRVYYADEKGRLQTGWQSLNNKWYYFDPDGFYGVTGDILDISGNTYRFDDNGAMITGWYGVKSPYYDVVVMDWYYYRPSGIAAEGWLQIGSDWYYFNSDNCMVTGTIDVDFKCYMFDENGKLVTTPGLHTDHGTYYVENRSGELSFGWKQIGGKWYYFEPCAITGLGYDVDCKYVFNDDGTMVATPGWKQINWIFRQKSWVYVKNSSGELMNNEWAKIGGKWYYFDSSSVIVSGGARKIGGTLYLFDENGAWIQGDGWKKVEAVFDTYHDSYLGKKKINWYYLENSVPVDGWQKIKGVDYHFTDGRMDVGTSYIYDENGEGEYRYFTGDGRYLGTSYTGFITYDVRNADGTMTERVFYYGEEYGTDSWVKKGNDWYFYGFYGLVNDCVKYDGSHYYAFAFDGKLITTPGWHKISSRWVYVKNKSGELAEGWQLIGGKWYYFKTEAYYWGDGLPMIAI